MAKALPVFAVSPDASLAENAPLILHTRLEEMYKFAPFIHDPANVEELHNMRIAAKRLRYTLEVFAPVFRSKGFTALYDQVKDIQERIGDIHDADVRIPLLHNFAQKHGSARPEIRVGLEALVHAQQQKRDQLYRDFLKTWTALNSEGFKKQFMQVLLKSEN